MNRWPTGAGPIPDVTFMPHVLQAKEQSSEDGLRLGLNRIGPRALIR
jgi:hypothetical protein